MIKNIVFDLGNVILKDSPEIVLNSLELGKNELENITNEFFYNREGLDLDLGKCNVKQHFERCKFNFEIKTELAEKLMCYYKYRPFNDEVVELIKRLKKENYRVYILSNNNIDVKEYLMELPFFKNLDGAVISCDYGKVKPDSEIYNILFEKYSLIPEECFFVDDSERNVKAGENLGMKGFVFNYKENGVANLIKELKLD